MPRRHCSNFRVDTAVYGSRVSMAPPCFQHLSTIQCRLIPNMHTCFPSPAHTHTDRLLITQSCERSSIPCHCSTHDNETAYRLAKEGRDVGSHISFAKTKPITKDKKQKRWLQQLPATAAETIDDREKKAIIMRLTTGQCRLGHHVHHAPHWRLPDCPAARFQWQWTTSCRTISLLKN